MSPATTRAPYPVRRGVERAITVRPERRRRRRYRVEHLLHDVRTRAPLHPELRLEHEPVTERRLCHRLHVVRRDEVSAGQRGAAARELEQREAAARARAHRDARALARAAHERDDVAADVGADVDVLDRGLHREQGHPVDDRLQLDLVHAPLDPPGEHLPLVVRRRIAERGLEQEAVELRLGQRVGALVLDRVLRGEHEERALAADASCRRR